MLFVEGGAEGHADLNVEARKGFTQLLERAGFTGRKPRVVPCGSRRMAYEAFAQALQEASPDDVVLLLVDSEGPVSHTSPWDHVRHREGDGWTRPQGATDDQLQLMVQDMETWLTADRGALARFYGKEFKIEALPAPSRPLEGVARLEIDRCLKAATKDTPAGPYAKGDHSFKLLGLVDPAHLRRLPWADRFFDALDRML